VRLRSSIGVLVNRIAPRTRFASPFARERGRVRVLQSKVAHLTANPSPSSSPLAKGRSEKGQAGLWISLAAKQHEMSAVVLFNAEGLIHFLRFA
jgi:hypothetical protein